MSRVPAKGTELIRPFIPSKDFELSKRFYEALGFQKVFDGEVAIFEVGSAGFILQQYFHQGWAENCTMQLLVDDLDAWWAHIESLDLSDKFGVPAPRSPAMQPWGLRVAYAIDPAGVLWHLAQRRVGAKQEQIELPAESHSG
jgi:catechol 2,3-dioxygenase-like lactoylglutathione lyase family enzyme